MIYKKMINFGFVKDENFSQLNEVFKDNAVLKEAHIDIYPEHPLASSTSFMLLLRSFTYDTLVSNNGDRIILRKSDGRHETQLMNILFSKITECYYKTTSDISEFILSIQNIHYRITVLN